MKLPLILVTILIVSLSANCLADSTENLLKCAEKKDSLVRLLCYDDIAKGLVKSEVASTYNAVPSGSIASNSVVNKVPKANMSSVQKPPVLSQENQFGSEGLTSKNKQSTEELSQLVTTIKSIKKTVYEQWNIVFDNDQVWKQVGSDYIRLAVGDEVVVSKGALGSYKLKKAGSNRSIRVKRSK